MLELESELGIEIGLEFQRQMEWVVDRITARNAILVRERIDMEQRLGLFQTNLERQEALARISRELDQRLLHGYDQSDARSQAAFNQIGPDHAQVRTPSTPAATTTTVSSLRSQGEFFMAGVIPVDTVATPLPKDTDCSVCLEHLSEDVVKITACGHIFHTVCVLGWFDRSAPRDGTKKGTCPNCRTELYEPDERSAESLRAAQATRESSTMHAAPVLGATPAARVIPVRTQSIGYIPDTPAAANNPLPLHNISDGSPGSFGLWSSLASFMARGKERLSTLRGSQRTLDHLSRQNGLQTPGSDTVSGAPMPPSVQQSAQPATLNLATIIQGRQARLRAAADTSRMLSQSMLETRTHIETMHGDQRNRPARPVTEIRNAITALNARVTEIEPILAQSNLAAADHAVAEFHAVSRRNPSTVAELDRRFTQHDPTPTSSTASLTSLHRLPVHTTRPCALVEPKLRRRQIQPATTSRLPRRHANHSVAHSTNGCSRPAPQSGA